MTTTIMTDTMKAHTALTEDLFAFFALVDNTARRSEDGLVYVNATIETGSGLGTPFRIEIEGDRLSVIFGQHIFGSFSEAAQHFFHTRKRSNGYAVPSDLFIRVTWDDGDLGLDSDIFRA